VAGRIEDHAAIDDAWSMRQPKALEHRGQVPGVNRLVIHCCLTTHSLQPSAIQKRWP
jgi:hypothetical protein